MALQNLCSTKEFSVKMLRTAEPYFGFAVAIFMLVGCGGGSPNAIAPPSFGGGTVQNVHRELGKSWASPAARTQPRLLYVTNDGNDTVTFYDYTIAGASAMMGTITGLRSPTQPCFDRNGNVFIPEAAAGRVEEYAFGSTTVLHTLHTQGTPFGCSVDRANTGNLAVANLFPGDIVVFETGTHPHTYNIHGLHFPQYVAYDAHGNLFADGQTGSIPVFGLALLRGGRTDFKLVHVQGGSINYPGQIQWGGTNLMVGDAGVVPSVMNQVSISGDNGTIVRSTALPSSVQITGFWRRANDTLGNFAAADLQAGNVKIYSWPSATLVSTLTNGVSSPFGTVIVQRPLGP
jgi:hypothetical protein